MWEARAVAGTPLDISHKSRLHYVGGTSGGGDTTQYPPQSKTTLLNY